MIDILKHKNERYPISSEHYQGILTLSTIVDDYRFKRRYMYYSKQQALKMFKQELQNELNK